jgi:DNA-binding response OmpR family regulator
VTCPFCDGDGIEVDLNSNNLRIDGKQIKLRSLHAELLSVLVDRPGKYFSKDELLVKLYGYEYDVDRYETLISTLISSLRKTLASTSFHIDNIRGKGYSLIRADHGILQTESGGIGVRGIPRHTTLQ